jgi:cytochrome c
MRLIAVTLAAAAVLLPVCVFARDAAGKEAFTRCSACHSIGENAGHRMGPKLNGVVGRQAGTQEGFGYSRAMMEAGKEGLVWTAETLASFIRNPHEVVPGTKMDFAGFGDDEAVAAIVAYVLRFSPEDEPAETPAGDAPQ